MLNFSRKQPLIVLAALLALQCPGLGAFAQHITPATGHAADLPAIAQHYQLVDNVPSGFEAFDESPLDNRMPLVLVHGIGGTESRLFHWENFLSYVKNDQAFNQKYKIYLYHYDSTKSVPNISSDLSETLKGFVGALGGRNIKILAYSEGGLLVRNALQDKYLDDHTTAVLTIATPFHGSPLANPDWMNQQVRKDAPLGFMRLAQRIAYTVTGKKYPTFKQDFRWDNFDGAIPADQYLKSNGPTASAVDYALAKKKNFITYGSYFGLDVDPGVIQKELDLKAPLPKEKLMARNLFHKNMLFSLVRNNIGKLPIAKLVKPGDVKLQVKARLVPAGTIAAVEPAVLPLTPAETLALAQPMPAQTLQTVSSRPAMTVEPVSMMMYNDGISPISSTLWLGRYTGGKTGVSASIPADKLWSTLKSLQGNKNTRLFAGLDHRNWMDGITRTGETTVKDLLNPDEPPKSVFAWIVHDLMG